MERTEREPDVDLTIVLKKIIDSNRYMTLATADDGGRPWASPVWFAHDAYKEFFWVSRPDAKHSRNLVIRPELAMVIFDSTVPPGSGQAVYVAANGAELSGQESDRAIAIYSRRSVAHGAGEWILADVSSPAPHRLYRARASEHFVLQGNDRRIAVRLG
jgi:uncharacterized protein YhbP (UPF0306 family)